MAEKLEIVRGTSNTLSLTVKDANDEPYTLQSGDRLLFGVKKEPSDTEYVIIKAITRQADGAYVVELTPADTNSLLYGRYHYDVGLENGTNYFNVIEVSPFVIQPNVTSWGAGA